jgi:hypothetical protein
VIYDVVDMKGKPFQFSLFSLFVLTTLVAVACSVWKTMPALGVVLTTAACIGLFGLALRWLAAARHGRQLSGEEKLLAFFNSMWVVGVVLMVALMFVVLLGFVWYLAM